MPRGEPMRRTALTIALGVATAIVAAAVDRPAAQTTPQPANGAFADYTWRSIGPASIGGRISDVEALDADFRFALVAAASGGVWKTTNAGTTWTPIFDRYGAAS